MSEKKHKYCTSKGQAPRYVGQKQSSIEWFVEKLSNKIGKNIIVVMHNEIQQAKEMHEKEIIKACGRGYIVASDGFPLQEAINYAEQYYKEKFGGNNEK